MGCVKVVLPGAKWDAARVRLPQGQSVSHYYLNHSVD